MARAGWTVPLPVRRIREDEGNPLPRDGWPASLTPVRQVLDDGLELDRITMVVGANGVGKSTLVEAVAIAFGMRAEGGGTGAMGGTYGSESSLAAHLRLDRGPGASRWGYFLRAETLHGLFTYLAGSGRDGAVYHRMSHGESFLALLDDPARFDHGGLIVMDEPEAGLSFESQLTLLGRMIAIAEDPLAQLLVATHSPVISALPGARLLELDSHGIRETRWENLAVVDHYRRFTQTPQAYLRHIVE